MRTWPFPFSLNLAGPTGPEERSAIYENRDAVFIAWSLREHAKYQRRYRSDVVLHHTDWDRIAQVIEELLQEKKS